MTPFFECEAYVNSKLRRPAVADVAEYRAYEEGPEWWYEGDQLVVNTLHINCDNTSQYSDRSHLRFGYGRMPTFGLPQLPFSEVVGPIVRPPMSWAEENQLNARRIKAKYGDIALCLSGGIDSELMVATFLDAGVKFEVHTLVYRGIFGDILNAPDYWAARQFADRNDLNLIEHDVDIIADLVQDRHLDYFIDGIEETKFLLPTLYTQQLLVDKLNDAGMLPIFGSDQVEIKINRQGKPVIGESLFSLGLSCPTWAHRLNKPLIYDFFMYSPEAVHAYLAIPEVRNATTVGDQFKADVSHKYGSRRLGPKRPKLTGYEAIRDEMARVGYDFHAITMANIDRVDWSKRPMSQYIHSIESVLANGCYCEWDVLRTTSNDFLCRGFIQDDPAYYDI